jgi:uncharacterized protein (AIM24 family)
VALVIGRGTPAFGNETERTLRIDVDGSVWMKPGAAIAYRGALAFERLPTIGAVSGKDALLREVEPLVRATGKGRLYCGHHAAHIGVVQLAGEPLIVSSSDVLAFESTLDFRPDLVAHGVSIAAGGLFVFRFSGRGSLALLHHGQPITLDVSPENPVSTDPHATLAWSPSLTPALKMDVSWRSAFGHGGHQPVQMYFEGSGFVVVQPYQRAGWFDADPHPVRKVASLVMA